MWPRWSWTPSTSSTMAEPFAASRRSRQSSWTATAAHYGSLNGGYVVPGAIDPDGRCKLLQALDLPVPATFSRNGGRPADRLAAALRAGYREVLEHDPGTRLGSDPERVT